MSQSPDPQNGVDATFFEQYDVMPPQIDYFEKSDKGANIEYRSSSGEE
jgi:hypothetical protein